jgi:hypothetical protein
MKYKTEYIVIEGNKQTFEERVNKRSEEGYIYCGNMNTNIDDDTVYFTLLMSKATLINE